MSGLASILPLISTLLGPPAGVDAREAPVGAPAQTPGETYDLDGAKADVEIVIVDRGKAYLDARARLEAHPALAAEAVMARLEGVPAPGPEKRDRLLNVLAALERPEDVAMFGDQLRAAMLGERPTELWFQLLRRQGPAAAPALIKLVGDRELSNSQRGELLELLVELTASDGLDALVAMVGRGADELQDVLRRALIRRARADGGDRSRIAVGLDAALDAETEAAQADPDPAPAYRLAQLLILRAACCEVDEGFTGRLIERASSESAPFVVRVAAIDGLGRLELGATALTAIVEAHGPEALAGDQASEILVALALEAMPAPAAAPLVAKLSLTAAAAPRLAELGYRYAELAPDSSWIGPSQQHPWPEVRKAALERVAETGGCDKSLIRALGEFAGPISSGGDRDTRVGRAAIGALGRCGGEQAFETLSDLLEDPGVDLTQRAAAARQLVEHDPSGPDYVAELLLDGRYPDLDRELASALGHAPAASDIVRDALCRTSRANPMVASTAHESLSKLFPGQGCE